MAGSSCRHRAPTRLPGKQQRFFLRREIVPLPRPHSLDEGWYPDPTGRFSGRFWNGEAWTFHVFTGSEEDHDPPTRRVPIDLLQ